MPGCHPLVVRSGDVISSCEKGYELAGWLDLNDDANVGAVISFIIMAIK